MMEGVAALVGPATEVQPPQPLCGQLWRLQARSMARRGHEETVTARRLCCPSTISDEGVTAGPRARAAGGGGWPGLLAATAGPHTWVAGDCGGPLCEGLGGGLLLRGNEILTKLLDVSRVQAQLYHQYRNFLFIMEYRESV
ncbi:hypothetical protein C4D60_Mb10t12040 [Musa balbisiana]|uniref:Uncharacterized protein n=1 Tax=Musa balbisiana TaxID=52838 RepID=A0A4S8IWI9_MUSBA|nr:hypothetical protein C4D60_Mb10t12040 [Musa balbisiana]